MPLASLTSTLQDLLVHHGALAVFCVMAVDAILPVGGELTMLLAGALAAGALGSGGHTGLSEYLLLSLAGTAGYLAGSIAGWWIGDRGGREFIHRHGRWLHLSPERFARAEAWFDRHGRMAVFLGRLTPLVRSFISIPAGVLGFPFRPYVVLTTAASAIWCFGFAGVGWALGSNYDQVHHAFRYADIAAIVAVLAGVAVLARSQRRRPATGRS
jgi:membrane protein DedA with SNARE-associated domain